MALAVVAPLQKLPRLRRSPDRPRFFADRCPLLPGVSDTEHVAQPSFPHCGILVVLEQSCLFLQNSYTVIIFV